MFARPASREVALARHEVQYDIGKSLEELSVVWDRGGDGRGSDCSEWPRPVCCSSSRYYWVAGLGLYHDGECHAPGRSMGARGLRVGSPQVGSRRPAANRPNPDG